MVQQFVPPQDPREARFLDYPYGIGGDGAARTTTAGDHLRDLIVQVLLTNPGERVNLPEFGVGVQRLVFAPNNEALRSSTQFLVTANLRRWLGDAIDVDAVTVSSVMRNDAVRLASPARGPSRSRMTSNVALPLTAATRPDICA